MQNIEFNKLYYAQAAGAAGRPPPIPCGRITGTGIANRAPSIGLAKKATVDRA
jgi:hypothetical protein